MRVPSRPAALLAGLGLAACFRGALPARELYQLRPQPAAAPPALADAAAAPSIAVEAYTTPGVYADPQIVYRVGDAQYGTYPTREWAVPLGTMLATRTAEALRAALPGAERRVQDGPLEGPARGLVWRGTVREFEEVDRGRQVSAAVQLEARLVRAADDSTVWQGSARAERAVTPSTSMPAVVDSLAAAAGASIAELVRSASPTIRAAARR